MTTEQTDNLSIKTDDLSAVTSLEEKIQVLEAKIKSGTKMVEGLQEELKELLIEKKVMIIQETHAKDEEQRRKVIQAKIEALREKGHGPTPSESYASASKRGSNKIKHLESSPSVISTASSQEDRRSCSEQSDNEDEVNSNREFVPYVQCSIETRFGNCNKQVCTFLHKKAIKVFVPTVLCRWDIHCTNAKCTFIHTKKK